MTKEELLTALKNPKNTISNCKRLRYIDASLAEEAVKLIEQLVEDIKWYRESREQLLTEIVGEDF
jgi:hypothetical protein